MEDWLVRGAIGVIAAGVIGVYWEIQGLRTQIAYLIKAVEAR